MKRLVKLSAVFILVLSFSSCSFFSNNQKEQETVKPVQTQAAAKLPTIEETVSTLCSEKFQGRLAGSEGNDEACKYVEGVFKQLKLEPLFEDSYYHKYYQNVINKREGNKIDFKTKLLNNVVGVIKGKENNGTENNDKKAVVISAHFDHIGVMNGTMVPGALDNASGTATLLEVAHKLKEKSNEKPFDMDIIICAFNGEESGLCGSRAFAKDIHLMYYNVYDINIDCIGSKKSENHLALKSKSKISNKLTEAMKVTMKKNKIAFKEVDIKGGTSDHKSFEDAKIPNVFIGHENVKELIHKPSDTPDSLDYELIKKVTDAICDFVESNNGVQFNAS